MLPKVLSAAERFRPLDAAARDALLATAAQYHSPFVGTWAWADRGWLITESSWFMDILPLLDEIQTIARNGLNFTPNPYDRERYERLLEVVAAYYGQTLDLPPPEVRRRLIGELGYITPKVGAHAAIFDAADGILVVRRADDGRWCLPCGWEEPNEAPDETVVREVREETGLDIR